MGTVDCDENCKGLISVNWVVFFLKKKRKEEEKSSVGDWGCINTYNRFDYDCIDPAYVF